MQRWELLPQWCDKLMEVLNCEEIYWKWIALWVYRWDSSWNFEFNIIDRKEFNLVLVLFEKLNKVYTYAGIN